MHTLSPETLMNAHLAPFLAEHHGQLSRELSWLEEQNTEVARMIGEEGGETERLVRGLEEMVGDLERAAGLLAASKDVEGLVGETREVDVEVGSNGDAGLV